MPVTNAHIARFLATVANALDVRRVDRFKVRAYRNAARSIQGSLQKISDLIDHGEDLTDVPRVGRGIAKVIDEFVRTGRSTYLDELMSSIPPAMADAVKQSRLDPHLVARVYKRLHIRSLEDLRERLKSGEIKKALGGTLAGKLERAFDERTLLRRPHAEALAATIRDFLKSQRGVRECVVAGSLRRKAPVIEELVIGVVTDDFAATSDRLMKSGIVESSVKTTRAFETTPGTAGFLLNDGLPLRLVHVSHARAGLQTLEITGSERHWKQLQKRPGIDALINSRKVETEQAAYRKLGLPFIEPELREGNGEVDAARSSQLPRLICRGDIRGDLHAHTVASDGGNTILQMARAARSLGYEYLAITDHSKRLKLTNGLDERRLLRQMETIDRLNDRLDDFRILKSSEVDILADGTLDFPDHILARLDLVIGSVHSKFGLSRGEQTARMLKALDNPYMTILGHATGRLLLSREPYEVDMDKIIAKARLRGCWIELNSDPHRLDIGSDYCRATKEMGGGIAISTDSHSIEEFDNIEFGIAEARRGWIEPSDVLNTLSLQSLKKRLRLRPARY